MKKGLFILAALLLVCLALCFTACGPADNGQEEHTHTFNLQNTRNMYIKHVATCTSAAEYFYSCECGEAGIDTFKSGAPIPHTYDRQNTDGKYLKTVASCTSAAEYYYSCACGEASTDTFQSGEPSHTFDLQNAEDKYIKTAASCTSAAEYFYSCKCGLAGTDTFKSGEPLPHTYDQKNTDDKYLKTAASCTSAAKYYYSCACGEAGTTTFILYGTSLGHDIEWSADENYVYGNCRNQGCTEAYQEVSTLTFSANGDGTYALVDCGGGYWNSGFPYVIIPSTFKGCAVTTIESGALVGLYTMTIPESVTLIKSGAIRDPDPELQEIYYGGTIDDWNNITKESGWMPTSPFDLAPDFTIWCSDGNITP